MKKQMTLADVAEATGLDIHTISDIERGKRKPQARTLARIADALDLSPEEILGKTPASSRDMSPEAELDSLDIAPLLGLNKRLSEELLQAREAKVDPGHLDGLYERLWRVTQALNRKGPFTEAEASVRRRTRQRAEQTALEADTDDRQKEAG